MARLTSCTPAAGGRSVARFWNNVAVDALREGAAPEPVQARDLYDLALAVRQAYSLAHTPSERDAAISYAAYRLLLSQASHTSNLARDVRVAHAAAARTVLLARLHEPVGPGAALGNRIAAAAIAAGGRDGSNESLHYADPTYTPQNQPLIVAQAGSTVHDATFWQPLALAQVSPRGSGAVPAAVQSFVGSQWGGVRTFAGKVAVAAPTLGDPDGAAYRQAAIAAIRATAGTARAGAVDASPAAWNAALDGCLAGDLRTDVEIDVAFNAALNDVAVAAYGAKRTYQTPRPISMIRYLAFNGAPADRRRADATRRQDDPGPAPRPLGAWRPLGTSHPHARLTRVSVDGCGVRSGRGRRARQGLRRGGSDLRKRGRTERHRAAGGRGRRQAPWVSGGEARARSAPLGGGQA